MKRYAARADRNQAEIMAALKRIGADVLYIGSPVDLLVGYRGRNELLEVKDGTKPPSARALTTAEAEFINRWRGTVYIVASVDEAIRAVTQGG